MRRFAAPFAALCFSIFSAAGPLFAQCTGDCDGNGSVSVDELVTGVNIALGNATVDTCTSFDRDNDGEVKINELITGVNNALEGCPVIFPPAAARKITDPADLIGGPLAVGRVGDYLIANSRVRAIIRDVGRQFSFMLTYGGNIVDADLVRPVGEPGRDNFGAMTPLINISSTVNVQRIEVVNDGSNGQPAVIRTFGVDDLFDAIDPTNAIRGFGAGSVPVSAQDKDLPVEIMTEYTLRPGDEAIRIETFVKNNGTTNLQLYAGDFVNGSGELDTFVPGLGWGEANIRLQMPFLAYTGVGNATGLSYGIVPTEFAGAFAQSGLTIYLSGQDVISALLGGQPGALPVAAGATGSFTRYFTVGDGDANSVARNAYPILTTTPVGTVSGRVTAGGSAVEGALVAVVRKPGEAGAVYDVLDSFRTTADGTYNGVLPAGNYILMAKLAGHPYDSGTMQPTEHPITVPARGEVTQDFSLPATGSIRVTVTDGTGTRMPAKATIVGFDPSPDPKNRQQIATFGLTAAVFNSTVKQKSASLFGITDVHFVPVSGDTGVLPLQPGTYEVVVTRGPEFSLHRERITVAGNQTTTVDAKLVRVVDTTGFVSGDYHVHLINSPDSNVTREERILTMAAEGVEYFAATDHDFLTTLADDVARIGATPFVKSVTGAEITTFNLGHYNAWPMRRDPTSITGGSPDWGRSGVAPGLDYPSSGSFDLSLAELFADVRTRFEPDADSGVLQINHFNDSILGALHVGGIDTALVPPQSFTDPRKIRQNPSQTNLYSDEFTALEVWIEASRAQTALFYSANLGDWFNLLNQGRRKTATADSDTHTTAIIQAGGPRNYIAAASDSPPELTDLGLADSVNAGRVVGSNGPFVRVEVEGDNEAVAGLALNQPLLVAASSHEATLRVQVQSPEWAEFDTVSVYVNTVPTSVPDRNFNGATVPRYLAAPTLERKAGTDFTVSTVDVDPGTPGAKRLEANLSIPLTLERDSWVIVIVTGTDGVSKPLWPMNPQDLDPAANLTLDNLTDGNLGELGNTSLAFTNPVFIDVDGNGQFDAPMTLP